MSVYTIHVTFDAPKAAAEALAHATREVDPFESNSPMFFVDDNGRPECFVRIDNDTPGYVGAVYALADGVGVAVVEMQVLAGEAGLRFGTYSVLDARVKDHSAYVGTPDDGFDDEGARLQPSPDFDSGSGSRVAGELEGTGVR